MKKKTKAHRKLTLHRETLRHLDGSQVSGVVGGTLSRGISYCDPCQTGTHCNISLCICD